MDFGQIKNLIRGGREREIERGEGGLKKNTENSYSYC